ncbi:hypothetical protein [Actinacidiphila yeochonensis]|uniref:hypothetical protein n=1 Tax=Actinacidiphila yeochonensis TaxID=89050 RepID=UPI000567C49F|nr:hypothetical protein [Actinacidiphila yeochonensis]
MKITDLSGCAVDPGRVVSFALGVPEDPGTVGAPPDGRPPAYVQEAHIRTVRDLRERGVDAPAWVGTAFDLPAHTELAAVEHVLRQWTLRHETLRSGFAWEGDGLRRFTLAPEQVRLRRTDHGHHARAEDVCRLLQERFDAATNPLQWPNFVYAVVQSAQVTRLYLGFDHTNVDAYSINLMPAQIRGELARYAAQFTPPYTAQGCEGSAPAPQALTRPPAPRRPEPEAAAAATPGGDDAALDALSGNGRCESRESHDSYESYDSYVDFCGIERAQADEARAADAAVERWRSFIAACGGALPSFPLDTGVCPGDFPEQHLWTEMITDADQAAAFDARCRAHGGVLPGLVAASALVVQEAGGPSTYRTVVPFHTRATSRWDLSVGWYVGVVPVEIATGEARDFADLLTMARAALRADRRLARLPVARALALLGEDFRPSSPDLFSLLSYTDSRAAPGAADWEAWRSRTLLRVSRSDQVCVWTTRVHDGLQLVVRYPDTPQAQKSVARYAEGLRAVVNTVARTGR